MCPGIGLEGRFRWFACPLGAVVYKNSCVVVPCFIPDPCFFAPCSLKVAVGVLVSLHFLFRIFPSCTCVRLFLVPLRFLCIFIIHAEVCPGASIAVLQQRVPGPSLTHLFNTQLQP